MPDREHDDIAERVRAMPRKRFREINDLLDAALDLPSVERSAYLDAQGAGDPGLRREVEALLASLEEAGSFLERPACGSADASHAPPRNREGERIGAYQILRRIGQGGMATVYLADRDDVRKQVALKVMAGTLASPAHIQRFLFERRLLARLEHPNIARLLDAGVTDDGVPYFAMEYVDGQHIDEYCNTRRLAVSERLELFRTVCGAVHYAHQNQVVHRDLKPSNVLVSEEGGVRLLDFGVAKLLEDDGAESEATRTATRLMTPAYASPEQRRGASVNTTSDVYSLGLVLFELLAGRRPGPGGDPGGPAVAEVASAAAVGGASIALERSTTPDRLRRQLSGDLDAICLKALRDEPERRYPSVEQLSEDIRRHLVGRPVSARRESAAYLLGKFARRNRLAVAALLLVVLSLAGGVAATAWQARLAAAQRDKAEQVAAVLPELFWSLEPGELRTAAVTPEQMLDHGIEKVEARLAEHPEVRARVLNLASDVYLRLAAYAKAERVARQALELGHHRYGDRHEDVASSMAMLAQSLQKQARYEEAEPLHRKALALHRDLLGDGHPDLATSLHQYAILLDERGAFEQAEALYREALEIRRSASEVDPSELAARNVAFTQTNLAVNLYYQERFVEAERLAREALHLRRRRLGDAHPDIANSLHNLASILHAQGVTEEVVSLYRECVEILRRVHGPEHPDISYPMSRLALALGDLGQPAQAETLLREALNMQRRAFGDEHPDVAQTRGRLGACLTTLGRRAEAEPLLTESLARLREAFGVADDRTQYVLRHLVALYEAWERINDAEIYRAEILE